MSRLVRHPCGGSEDVGDVVAAGANAVGQHASVLVARGGGDLSGVVPVAGGLGRVRGAERVADELARVKDGGARVFLDDQRDGLGG